MNPGPFTTCFGKPHCPTHMDTLLLKWEKCQPLSNKFLRVKKSPHSLGGRTICTFDSCWFDLFHFLFSKVGLSPSKKKLYCLLHWKPLKMMKNAFYFILKALSALKIFKFLSWIFGHVEKIASLERQGLLQNSWHCNRVNKQLQYTYCPVSREVKAT